MKKNVDLQPTLEGTRVTVRPIAATDWRKGDILLFTDGATCPVGEKQNVRIPVQAS